MAIKADIGILGIACALAFGCGGPGVAEDGGGSDAGLGDASILDATSDAEHDARVDAWSGLDASHDGGADASDPWTGTPCSVGGTPGICRDVASCEGTSTAGFCPGPAYIQCCTITGDGGPMDGSFDAGPRDDAGSMTCDPEARPQPNAGLTEDPGVGGCPAGMLPVAGFCVDRYEASLLVVEDDGSTRPHSPYFNPGDLRVRAVSLRGAVPQGYIDGRRAAEACLEAGKRLCTDTEWLRACRGPDDLVFPYGATRDPGECNDARSRHPAVEYFGSSEPWVFGMIQHPCLNQLEDGLEPTGDHPGCESAEGPFDMMGNLHEWTADPAGTFRGGFYVDTERNGPGCLYRTTAHDTAHWDYSTGFRCCADAT